MEKKCAVVCRDSNGTPDIVFVVVDTTQDMINEGEHLVLAQEEVESKGYEDVAMIFDDDDPAWRYLNPPVPPLDEDVAADFMLQRIENGSLSLEEIPSRLVRYGLMPVHEFVAEMQERMTASQDVLADQAFESYDFGDGGEVVSHDHWNRDDPDDWTKVVYWQANDAEPDSPSERLTFHARFKNGALSECYALDLKTGNEVGTPGHLSPA